MTGERIDARMLTERFIVEGRVQGVGFRYFVEKKASALALKGFVRNLPDGRVECVASGKKEDLDLLYQHLLSGPPLAKVTGVARSVSSSESYSSFDIR